jgi:hypothetical protein
MVTRTLSLVTLPQEVMRLRKSDLARELGYQSNAAVGSKLAAAADDSKEEEERKAVDPSRRGRRASSATDRVTAVFDFLEQEWHHWEDPRAHPAPVSSSPIDSALYMHNLTPADLRGGAKVITPSEEEEEDEDADLDSFFRSSSVCRSSLCQDHFKYDPRSLYHLLPKDLSCPGIFEALLYFKCGCISFPLHGEQLGLRFTHHQLSGDSLWIVLQPGQEQKLEEWPSVWH